MKEDLIFNQIKNKVLNTLAKPNLKTVSSTTQQKVSGIYMIYVDNFKNDNFVPIYIGKSVDIQKRHKEHYTEILALNRLHSEEYHKYFYSKKSSFYEGKFKSPKIFKYMLENSLTLKDFKMIILEECDKELLDVKEQYYFEEFLPSFVGFNQLNSFLELNSLWRNDITITEEMLIHYYNTLEMDIGFSDLFYSKAYTRFNLEHALPKPGSNVALLELKAFSGQSLVPTYTRVQEKLEILLKKYNLIEQVTLLHNMSKDAKEIRKKWQVAEVEFLEYSGSLEDDIINFFKQNSFNELIKMKYFIEAVIDNEKNKVTKYFRFLIDKKMKKKNGFVIYFKAKKLKNSFYENFEEQILEARKLKSTFNTYYNQWDTMTDKLEENRNNLAQERYSMIFPSFSYSPFPLKDNIDPKLIQNEAILNSCKIVINISNNGINRSLYRFKNAYIFNVFYSYIDIEGIHHTNDIYIDNYLSHRIMTGIKYIEEDLYDHFNIKPRRFAISSFEEDEIDSSIISILSEYKHGINDYSFQGTSLISLKEAINEIESLVNEETVYTISASESYNCLQKCFEQEGLIKNPFVEKLVTKKLPKVKKQGMTRKEKITKASKITRSDSSVGKIENLQNRKEKYKEKINERSNGKLEVLTYVSSKEKSTVKCKVCNHEWNLRSDHLLSRPWCPNCKKLNI